MLRGVAYATLRYGGWLRCSHLVMPCAGTENPAQHAGIIKEESRTYLLYEVNFGGMSRPGSYIHACMLNRLLTSCRNILWHPKPLSTGILRKGNGTDWSVLNSTKFERVAINK